MQTDVPGATIGLLTSLVDADIRYLSVAHNYAGRSAPHLVGGQDLTRPFYWRAPNGKRLLVWYTDSPHGSAYMEGNLVGLAEDYQATLAGIAGLPDSPRGASLPVPGAWGEHLRMDGPGSLLRGDESAVSSRCAPPEGAGRIL